MCFHFIKLLSNQEQSCTTPTFNSVKEKYVSARFNTIFHDLKNKILDGTYAYESYLPTEMELT